MCGMWGRSGGEREVGVKEASLQSSNFDQGVIQVAQAMEIRLWRMINNN